MKVAETLANIFASILVMKLRGNRVTAVTYPVRHNLPQLPARASGAAKGEKTMTCQCTSGNDHEFCYCSRIANVMNTQEVAKILNKHRSNLLRDVPELEGVQRQKVGSAWAWNKAEVLQLVKKLR